MVECPMDAISFLEDKYGFKYPSINDAKCISCGKCLKVCSYRNRKNNNNLNSPLEAYAATSKDIQLAKGSTSGGVYATLAKEFLLKGHYVCGAIMHYTDNSLSVNHILTNQVDRLSELQGSKYVQSDTWQAFYNIKKLVSERKYVLFCGTPCQVDAIKKIIGDSEYLYTIDLICHGVPSQKMFQDFMNNFTQTYKIPISSFIFIDKECKRSWSSRIHTVDGHKLYIHSNFLSYYQLFLKGIIYRKNCYNCPYANLNRVGDITIGDYWGIESCHKKEIEEGIVDLNKIWSCILVNSEKGKRMLMEYGSNLELISSLDKCIAKHNNQLNSPSVEPKERSFLLQLYASSGYKAIEKKYQKNYGGAIHFKWNMLKDILRNKKRIKK